MSYVCKADISGYVCMYVCMYSCMYVCMYVCMYACMYARSLDFHRQKDIKDTYTHETRRGKIICVSYVYKADISRYICICMYMYILFLSLFRRRKDIRSRLWPLTDSIVSAWKEEEEEEEECSLTVQNT